MQFILLGLLLLVPLSGSESDTKNFMDHWFAHSQSSLGGQLDTMIKCHTESPESGTEVPPVPETEAPSPPNEENTESPTYFPGTEAPTYFPETEAPTNDTTTDAPPPDDTGTFIPTPDDGAGTETPEFAEFIN